MFMPVREAFAAWQRTQPQMSLFEIDVSLCPREAFDPAARPCATSPASRPAAGSQPSAHEGDDRK